MELGAFTVSLAVKDLAASRAFYERLGFGSMGGDPDQGWLILKNGSTVIGLFQGMFDKNILTFNPGWDQSANPLPTFTDVREVQRALDAAEVLWGTNQDDFWRHLMVWRKQDSLLWWIVTQHLPKRRRMLAMQADPASSHTRVIRLASSPQVRDFEERVQRCLSHRPRGSRA